MKNIYSRIKRISVWLLPALLVVSAVAATQGAAPRVHAQAVDSDASEKPISETPLTVVGTQNSVAPNIMVTLEDFQTMGARYMPDSLVDYLSNSSNDANSLECRDYLNLSDIFHCHNTIKGVTFDPRDTVSVNGGTFNYFVISTRPDDPVAIEMRSARWNKIYYDPTETYSPWAWTSTDSSGKPQSHWPQADPEKAALTFDPSGPSLSTSPANLVNLLADYTTNTGEKVGVDLNLCIRSTKNQNGTFTPGQKELPAAGVWYFTVNECPEVVGETYHPATYYIYNGDIGLPVEKDPDGKNEPQYLIDNYEQVQISEDGIHVTPVKDAVAAARNGTPSTSQALASITIPNSPSRTDCGDPTDAASDTHTCTAAQEAQNFANWFVYYRNRMFTAIAGISQTFDNLNSNFRVGYGTTNSFITSLTKTEGIKIAGGCNGNICGVRPFSGDDRQNFFKWLFSWSDNGKLLSTTASPLRTAMYAVGDYYMDFDEPWFDHPENPNGTNADGTRNGQLSCRRSFNVLVTDGEWSGAWPSALGGGLTDYDDTAGPTIDTGDGTTYQYQPKPPYADSQPGTLADVAMYFWNRDLRPKLDNDLKPTASDPATWQHMVNFIVGIGTEGSLKKPDDLTDLKNGYLHWPPVRNLGAEDRKKHRIDDLWHAAINSHGEYWDAANPTQLVNDFRTTISLINAQMTGDVPPVSISSADSNTTVCPRYQTISWTGELSHYSKAVDCSTVTPADADWSASEELPSWDQRSIWMGVDGGDPVQFKWGTLNQKDANGKSALQLLGNSVTESMVDYLSGDQKEEGTLFRNRGDSVLGDIVNSNPLYVGDTTSVDYYYLPDAAGTSYSSFIVDKIKKRDPAIFVGANDGMLHAFDGNSGTEKYAYIPKSVVPNLHLLASKGYEHQYYVDGKLTEAPAYLGGWQDVLLGSTGAGAKSVFALDVTGGASDSQPKVLWDKNDADYRNSDGSSDLGYVLAPLQAGVTRGGQWVAIFGNGYHSQNGHAVLFVVDLEHGTLLETIPVGVGSTDAPNGLGGATLVRNALGQIIGAYAGDLRGNLWRFDFGDEDTPNKWTGKHKGKLLFTATDRNSSAQPIVAPPQVLQSSGRSGLMVFFGTGKLFDTGDETSTAMQTLYGVWDQQGDFSGETDSSTDPLTRENLQQLSFPSTDDTTGGTTGETTGGTTVDYGTQRGWYLDLSLAEGERNLYRPELLGDLVLFSTFSIQADLADPCSSENGAHHFVIYLDALTGADVNRFATTGPGINVVLKPQGNGEYILSLMDLASGGSGGGGGGGGHRPLPGGPKNITLGDHSNQIF